MALSASDLRLIICEDEYLLAMDMAQQFSALGTTVVATVGRVSELQQVVFDHDGANAVVLDVELRDGPIYALVPFLEQHGFAIAFCSGHPKASQERLPGHIAWFTKPAAASEIAEALCAVLAERSVGHN